MIKLNRLTGGADNEGNKNVRIITVIHLMSMLTEHHRKQKQKKKQKMYEQSLC